MFKPYGWNISFFFTDIDIIMVIHERLLFLSLFFYLFIELDISIVELEEYTVWFKYTIEAKFKI